jgi:hypothetical protein
VPATVCVGAATYVLVAVALAVVEAAEVVVVMVLLLTVRGDDTQYA